MRQTSIRNDIRLFIAQGYHGIDMRRPSSDIIGVAVALATVALAACVINKRECEYHRSGEGGATPSYRSTTSWPFMPRCPNPQTWQHLN